MQLETSLFNEEYDVAKKTDDYKLILGQHCFFNIISVPYMSSSMFKKKNYFLSLHNHFIEISRYGICSDFISAVDIDLPGSIGIAIEV